MPHYKPAICSHSLGRAWVHDLPAKLDQASRFGFDIEMFYEDLYYVAKELPGGATPENQIQAARHIRDLCDERDIAIICLQPFMHYEGLRDRQRHGQRIGEFALWIQLAHVLGTDLIAVPSTFLPEDQASGDIDLITQDMQEIADLAAAEGVRIAYEALAWGTYVDTWEKVWDIVERVDRSNFGICLDTYNMAARVYADPTSITGKSANADADMAASLRRLVQTVDVNKIAFVQIVDAELLAKPLLEQHEFYDPDQCARMSWSRNCRLFYGEEDHGAYLPIKAILKAILVDLGYKGPLSAEMFNRSLADASPSVPAEHAQRAAASFQKLATDFGLTSRPKSSANVNRPSLVEAPRAQL